MVDEAPFQFLHQELIQYIYKSNEQGEVRKLIRWILAATISDYYISTMSNP